MEKSTAVVFDLGKVLVDFDYGNAIRQLVRQGTITPGAIQEILLDGTLLADYELGKMTTDAFFLEVKRLAGFRGDFAAFEQIFGGVFTPIESMLQLNESLRRQGYSTFIFSNTSELVVRYLHRRWPFFREFNGYLLSFEHGLMKPDAAFYAVVERVVKRQGSQIVYIDDRPENVETGLKRGWQAICHQDPDVTRAKMVETLGPGGFNLGL